MKLLALGGNLPTAEHGPPEKTLEAALHQLKRAGIRVRRRSRWYRTRPVPDDGQAWFINGCAVIDTILPPEVLLQRLLECERRLGRVRTRKNAPRTVDLDLLAYDDLVRTVDDDLVLPHPRLHERLFVLVPLVEIAGDWRHPILKRSARELLAALRHNEDVHPLPS
jgi:2-amino-4-hydroxy-6-hydroxymethyldihydropteridine diphosphokinase